MPLSSVFGSDRIPAASVARIVKAAQAATARGEIPADKPWVLVEWLIEKVERAEAES